MIERLQKLAQSAAGLAAQQPGNDHDAQKLLENGLYLDRLRHFPEANEPSPYGRLVEYGNRMRIIRPKNKGTNISQGG